MSLPNIPDITPEIKLRRKQMINMLLASIAMEEIALSHIMNAEGEKIQAAIKHIDKQLFGSSIHELLLVNKSVNLTLRNTVKQQILLQYKLEDVIDLIKFEFEHDDDKE